MSVTPPTPPDFPLPTDSPEDFDDKAYDCFPYVSAAADNCYANAQASETAATASAVSATNSANSATSAAGSATASANSATAAASSLATAVLSPNTQATSTTSMLVGYGSKAFTLAQTGKAFAVGQFVSITSASNVSNWMNGAISSFNSGTGAITVSVTMFSGSGTYTDWNIAQSAPVQDTIYEIGDMIADNERGTLFVRNGRTFSRTGIALSSASYPLAAADTGTMINGIASTIPVSTAYTRGIATNGTGTWVKTNSASSTGIEVSTDGGATFSLVTHNVGCKAVDVVWNASVSRFIAVGCTNNIVHLAYSTNGTSWTAGTSLTPGITPTADTIRALCDGTTVVVVWIPTSGQYGIATTVNGTSYTQRTIAATGSPQNFYIAVLPALGGSRWIISGASTNADCYQSSNADGSGTWSAITMTGLSAIGLRNGFAAGNGIFIMTGVNSYATSANGTSWTVRNYPSKKSINRKDGFWSGAAGTGSYVLPNWLTFDGSRFVSGSANGADFSENAQGLFGYTTDGVIWSLRQLTHAHDTTSSGGQLMVFSSGSHLLAAQAAVASASTTAVQYSQNWVSSCDYVGKARAVAPAQIDGDSALVFYTRIA